MISSIMSILKTSCLLLKLFIFLFFPALYVYGADQTVHLPVTLDYSFLRSAFIRQAFNEPGEKAVPLDLGKGCGGIELWNPEVGPDTDKAMLKIGSNIKVKAGLPVGNTCLKLSEWDGYIEVFQKVLLDRKNMKLGLQTMDFQPMTLDKQRASVDAPVLTLIKSYLTPYLSKVVVDVDAPVKGLQGVLPSFSDGQDKMNINKLLASLKVGDVLIKNNGVVLDLLMDIDIPVGKEEKKDAATPTETDAQKLIKKWEDWDAFSVYQILSLSGQPVTEDEKSDILENMLQERYDFVNTLEEGRLTQDFVLQQFSETWQSISPIIRKYLSKQLSSSPSNFLSYTATADALTALKNIGPRLGINISSEGLLKMAQLLPIPGITPNLQYTSNVDNNLRTFFNLGESTGDPGPLYNMHEIDFPDGLGTESKMYEGFYLFSLLIPDVYADSKSPDVEKLKPWVFRKSEMTSYLGRIRQNLEKVQQEVAVSKKLDPKYHSLYRLAVMSTAWQESCWRQYIENKGKLRPIESYNQSSVGLMQINVRVWRGIYQPDALRWNIDYNMRTGCEILELYLRKYALKRKEAKSLDADTLARTLYAMYNGGPGQFQKFLVRKKNNKFLKVDQLFLQKYTWTKANQFDKLSVCLIGR